MGWSPETAVSAFLDTIRLCNSDAEETCDYLRAAEAESYEFVSAMAAGIKAQTIVELTHRISPYTIGLAAAARRTGGRLICILFESRSLEDSKQALSNYPDLESFVELKIGDSRELLKRYKNIDFLLADAKIENIQGLLEAIDMNTMRSAVVMNNLSEMKSLSSWFYSKFVPRKTGVRTVILPIGKGMEVIKIGRNDPIEKRFRKNSVNNLAEFVETSKSRWLVAVDRKTGEEHFFRVRRKYGSCSKRDAVETAWTRSMTNKSGKQPVLTETEKYPCLSGYCAGYMARALWILLTGILLEDRMFMPVYLDLGTLSLYKKRRNNQLHFMHQQILKYKYLNSQS